MIKVKRIYETASSGDGYRVLVDRIWPRGVARESARIKEWLPEIAPSPDLRRWYAHDPKRWDEFCLRYFVELKGKPEIVRHLRGIAGRKTMTLLFGARETMWNNAAALKIYLDGPA
jgi:uncharacterized protein YeaO (DUF488 family)